MWCFGRLLPLMIGKLISESDDHWLNFLLLMSIVDHLFAPILSRECSEYLKVLIADHHKTWTELYPSCNIIPKMHYMIHYPECIERYNAKYTVLCV